MIGYGVKSDCATHWIGANEKNGLKMMMIEQAY